MRTKLVALAAAFLMIAAGCGDSDDDAGGTTSTNGGATTTETTAAPDTTDTTDNSGLDMTTVDFTLFGAPTGAEGEAMQGFLDVYNNEFGTDVVYEGSDSFESQLQIRVDGGNPPSVAFTPQPGPICEYADAGELESLEDMGFDIAEMESNHGKFWMDLGICEDGEHYAIPWFPNFKSIIWYHEPTFESEGYEIPETFDDLLALADSMKTDGFTPLCVGYGSEAATGWPGTDWIEDILVRSAGADVYGKWFRHEIPFDSPEVLEAFEILEQLLFAEGNVLGGVENIAAIDFREAPLPMFNDPPSCLMHKQGSFVANYFPEGGESEVKFFPFPDIEGNTGAMGGGDTLMVFESSPEIVKMIKDWISPDWQCVLASPSGGTESSRGGHGVAGVERLPGNKDVSLDCYETETARLQAAAVRDALAANGFVFDASDLMPGAVGTGTFWTGMIDHSRGTPASEVVQQIEDSWPS